MNSAVKVVATIVLVIIVIVAIYGSFSTVWNKGSSEGEQKGSTWNSVLECVQENPNRGREWCQNQVTESSFETGGEAPVPA